MTRAAVSKLLLLVILAFIICLPEFFSSYRTSKVNFLCLPHPPCVQKTRMEKMENGKAGKADVRIKDLCDPSQVPDHEQWKQACAQHNLSNTSFPDSWRNRYDAQISWFVCEIDTDIAEINNNFSFSALKLHLEVSVRLQLGDAEALNLTLHGRSNRSSLYLHPPEEEEEKDLEKGADEGQREAFYCCLPLLPTSGSANQSRCLLWLANQTVSTATAKGKLPWKQSGKDEWRCVFRVVWLVLLCVVLLAIVTTAVGQVYRGKSLCRRPRLHPVGYNLTDGQKQKNSVTPRAGTAPHSDQFPSWSELSPIEEVDGENDVETLLDGNIDHCYIGNLHHRGHQSSLTEEQLW